jgi:hypothetical protein
VIGILGKAILRLGMGHPISVLHDDYRPRSLGTAAEAQPTGGPR